MWCVLFFKCNYDTALWFALSTRCLVEINGILDIYNRYLSTFLDFISNVLNLSQALHFYIARLQVPRLVFSNLSWKSGESRVTCLLLSLWHLFDEDSGHWMPACVRVSTLLAGSTLSNPEPLSHLFLVNVVTVTFNMTVTMKIVLLAGLHVKQAFNRPRRALGVIEGEIPTATAKVTFMNPEVTSEVDMEGGVCEVLHHWTRSSVQRKWLWLVDIVTTFKN